MSVKKDKPARDLFGDSLDKIPKSTFAVLAWHLANVCSESADTPGQAEQRLIEELDALTCAEILPAEQSARVRKTLVARRDSRFAVARPWSTD